METDKSGRLKIFFSYAEGTGKIGQMLRDAAERKKEGCDVVVGCVPLELDLGEKMEKLAPVCHNYQGNLSPEFDLDSAIRRRPGLLVIDRLAHGNAPGSRHRKRYQDIEELLRAGIDVYTTLNVQQIESLSDVISSLTGRPAGERVPDKVFDQADQVEFVDAEPEKVRECLGNNAADTGVLTALREMALRRMADRINKIAEKGEDVQETSYPGEHILTGISASPSNGRVIRTAARMADAFHGAFTALYVQTSHDKNLPDADKRILKENMELAEKLGARVITMYGDDVVQQIAEYARMAGVSKIVLGRTKWIGGLSFSRVSFADKLTALGSNPDIYIIPSMEQNTGTAGFRIRHSRTGFTFKDTLKTVGVLLASTGIGGWMYSHGISEVNIIMLYILGVVLTAMWTESKAYSLVSSFISVFTFNFFFTLPRYSFKAYGPEYPVTFIIMFLVAFLISTLTTRVKEQAHQAAEKAYRTEILLETSQKLQKARDVSQIIREIMVQMEKMLGRTVIFYMPDEKGNLVPRMEKQDMSDAGQYLNEKEQEVVSWVYQNNKHAGATTDTLPDAKCLYLAVRGRKEALAVAGIVMGAEELTAFERSLLLAMLNECALALEKQKLDEEKKEVEMNARQERLRANLLRAISHDLRTPLTGISGNASVLLNGSAQMEESQRHKIYGDIYDDAIWLINLVENLLSVTRIENGTMNLKRQTELLDDVINEAMHHLDRKSGEHKITVKQEDEFLMARMDTRLIVQVFINIIDNAIKYTPAGSEIKVHVFQKDGFVWTEIADNGNGVADADKNKLFQMFYTAENQKGDGRRGLGLGLALCKAIINAHSGEIGVRDNSPRGSVFYFTLPAEEVVIHE